MKTKCDCVTCKTTVRLSAWYDRLARMAAAAVDAAKTEAAK